MAVEAAWPLGERQAQLVAQLATVIAQGGRWRFLRGPVVGADTEDYPDPWEENRAAVAAVVARTLWHAHLAVPTTIEDVRAPAARNARRLYDTALAVTRVTASSIELELAAIGNDDIAGRVAHEIGRAFVGWIAARGAPFRASEGELPDAELGSIATVYLGLGVVATNAAHHPRSVGEVRGNSAYHEHQIAHAGGLPVDDLVFLLAVQATVRDDVLAAHATLRSPQAEEVAAWIDALDAHEDELARLLGLEDGEVDDAPVRPAAPAPVAVRAAVAERDLHKENLGRPVFRLPLTSRALAHSLAGMGLGLLAFAAVLAGVGLLAGPQPGTVGPIIGLCVVPLVGGILGFDHGRRRRFHRCASCRGMIASASEASCPSCGGRIVGEIAHANERLAREEEFEAAEAAKRDGAAP
jgi:hypothetical protein